MYNIILSESFFLYSLHIYVCCTSTISLSIFIHFIFIQHNTHITCMMLFRDCRIAIYRVHADYNLSISILYVCYAMFILLLLLLC